MLYDLMHYLENNDKSGLLISVYFFKKEFDSISWDFLKKSLKSFKFDPSICRWFESLCNEAKGCVINNGHSYNFFNIERYCRQGDPLSPHLFIIG